MFTTSTRRKVARTAIAGTAIVAAMAGFAGIASATPLTNGAGTATAPTTRMTITNDTGYTLWLNGSTNPHGSWINAPQNSLGPRQSEVVTARSDNQADNFTVSAAYQMDTNTTVDFVASNLVSDAKVDGSGIIGNGDGTYTVYSRVDNGGPEMNATYLLSPA